MRIIKVKNYDEVSVKTANLILGLFGFANKRRYKEF